MSQIWISAAGLAGSIFMGSLLGFFIKELPHKWNDAILGYCAGIMLAVSMLGLIVNAFNMTTSLPWWMIAVGVMLGALFLNVLDLITPHLHHITGLDEEEHLNNKSLDKILLFVMAIALHKMPEGMAAGVSMSTVETDWSVSVGIALQNIPEGMGIIAPLLMAGVSKMRTVVISLVIGLLEVIGVWVGFGMGSLSEMFLPVMLGFAGGAMLYVTSDELIPETHAHGYQKQATYALLLGVITFIAMEKYV